jgi:hypothetical protein
MVYAVHIFSLWGNVWIMVFLLSSSRLPLPHQAQIYCIITTFGEDNKLWIWRILCPSQSYSWSLKYPFMKILITNILQLLIFPLSLPPSLPPPPLRVWSKYSSQYPALETTNLFCSVIVRDRFHSHVQYIKWKSYSLVYCDYIVSHRTTFCVINRKRANFQICKTKTADRAGLSLYLFLSSSLKTQSNSRKARSESNNFFPFNADES